MRRVVLLLLLLVRAAVGLPVARQRAMEGAILCRRCSAVNALATDSSTVSFGVLDCGNTSDQNDALETALNEYIPVYIRCAEA